jgi:restriction endonuclease
MEAGQNSIYDQIQIDSDVEARFVEHRVRDQQKVLFYFEFSKKYCIDLPRIISNYNPDRAWCTRTKTTTLSRS